MTDEQKETIFRLFKQLKGRRNFDPDAVFFIHTLIDTAAAEIAKEGVKTDLTKSEDLLLHAMYCEWLYDKNSGEAKDTKMPRPLRWGLNQRIFS